MLIIDDADYKDFGMQDYIKNNIIIDYSDCNDYQDHLRNCIIMIHQNYLRWYIVSSDYPDYADTQLYVKNNFIIDYTDYVAMKGYYW